MSQAGENVVLLGDDSDDDIQVVSVVQGTGIIPLRPAFPLQIIPNTGFPKQEPANINDAPAACTPPTLSAVGLSSTVNSSPLQVTAPGMVARNGPGNSESATSGLNCFPSQNSTPNINSPTNPPIDSNVNPPAISTHPLRSAIGGVGAEPMVSNSIASVGGGAAPNTSRGEQHQPTKTAQPQTTRSNSSSQMLTCIPYVKQRLVCVVCGDPAVGFRHHAMSCDSCADFFLRGLSKFQQFQCQRLMKCPVTVVSRNDCHFCRFRKCIASGMVGNSSLGMCLVCGDSAAAVHHGVMSCDSCADFFVKSLSKFTRFQCRWNKKCTITVASRYDCQFCWFRKCIVFGMVGVGDHPVYPASLMTDHDMSKNFVTQSHPVQGTSPCPGQQSVDRRLQGTAPYHGHQNTKGRVQGMSHHQAPQIVERTIEGTLFQQEQQSIERTVQVMSPHPDHPKFERTVQGASFHQGQQSFEQTGQDAERTVQGESFHPSPRSVERTVGEMIPYPDQQTVERTVQGASFHQAQQSVERNKGQGMSTYLGKPNVKRGVQGRSPFPDHQSVERTEQGRIPHQAQQSVERTQQGISPFPGHRNVDCMSPYPLQNASLYSIQPSTPPTSPDQTPESTQFMRHPTPGTPLPQSPGPHLAISNVYSEADNPLVLHCRGLDIKDIKSQIAADSSKSAGHNNAGSEQLAAGPNMTAQTIEGQPSALPGSSDTPSLAPSNEGTHSACISPAAVSAFLGSGSGGGVFTQAGHYHIVVQSPPFSQTEESVPLTDNCGNEPCHPEMSSEQLEKCEKSQDPDYDPHKAKKKRGRKPKSKTATSPSERLVCMKCHQMFLKKSLFLEHRNTCQENQDDSSSDVPSPSEQQTQEEFFFISGVYKCKHCSFRSVHKTLMENHVKQHNSQFKCPICHKCLGTYAMLMRHKSIAHGTGVILGNSIGRPLQKSNLPLEFQCQECPAVFTEKHHLDRHIGSHRRPQNHFCPICNRPTPTKGHLNRHMKMEHNSMFSPTSTSENTGSETEESIGKSTDLSQRMDKNVVFGHHRLRNGKFVCKPCEYFTENHHNFAVHLRTTKHMGNLASHEKDEQANVLQGHHRGENGQFSCKPCRYSTENQYHFAQHLWSEKHRKNTSTDAQQEVNVVEGYHRDSNGIFFCKACDYSSEGHKGFVSHLITERHKKNLLDTDQNDSLGYCRDKTGVYHCKPCQFSTNRPSDFRRHIECQKHQQNALDEQNNEKFVCEPCSYSTHQRNDYYQHLETGEHRQNEARMRVGRKRSSSSSEGNVIKQSRPRKEPPSPASKGSGNETPSSAQMNEIAAANFQDQSITPLMSPAPSLVQNSDSDWESVGNKTVGLVTDFTDFGHRPYACALCFYRTGNLDDLQKHTQNHLTGGTETPKDDSNLVSTSGLPETSLNQIPSNPFPYSQSPAPGLSNCISSSFSSPPTMSSRNTANMSVNMNRSSMAGTTANTNQPTLPPPNIVRTPASMNQSNFIQPTVVGTPANMNASNFPQPNYPVPRPYFIPPSPFHYPQDSQFYPGMNFCPIVPQSALGQMRTDDLIDAGSDYVKEPSNPSPYQCLYCRQRVQTFMVLVGHFDTYHYSIVRAKHEQAVMRLEAACAAQATNVKTEVIDLD